MSNTIIIADMKVNQQELFNEITLLCKRVHGSYPVPDDKLLSKLEHRIGVYFKEQGEAFEQIQRSAESVETDSSKDSR